MYFGKQGSPRAVAEAIFDAAKSGRFQRLPDLIDTYADGNSRRIAEAEVDAEIARQFRLYFSDARVDGSAKIVGNQASVKIYFGLGGVHEETLGMVRRGGRWYLQSF